MPSLNQVFPTDVQGRLLVNAEEVIVPTVETLIATVDAVLDSINAKTPALSSGKVPVELSTIPLPTNAATENTLGLINTKVATETTLASINTKVATETTLASLVTRSGTNGAAASATGTQAAQLRFISEAVAPPSVPTITQVTLTNANTQYAVSLPIGVKKLSIKCRGAIADTLGNIRFSWVNAKVAGSVDSFDVIPINFEYTEDKIFLSALTSLYLASSTAGVVVSIRYWI